jgi:hypothetical protein
MSAPQVLQVLQARGRMHSSSVCVAGADIRTAVDADEVLQLLQMSSPQGQGGRGCVASQ